MQKRYPEWINNESWQENKVKDGDKLEIVSIVGGG